MSDTRTTEDQPDLVTPPDGASGGASAAKPAASGRLEEAAEGEFDATWAVLEALTDPNL